MNRIGLKDYLLNEASDSDLLDCAKAYDTARPIDHQAAIGSHTLNRI